MYETQFLLLMVRSRLFIVSLVVTSLALAPIRSGADLVDVANTIRLQGCGKYIAVDQPFSVQKKLDEAARHLAGGASLKAATMRSGYNAKESASIYLRNTTGDQGIASVLVQRFCDIIADPELREIGVFRRGNELWMILATPMALAVPDDDEGVGYRVLHLINEARSRSRRCGREKFIAAAPLQWSADLERAALMHAKDIADRGYLGHEGFDGSTPADRASRAGYLWASIAENVAAGQTTAAEVVDTWLASPGHCANLMRPRYSQTGVAYAVNPTDERSIYWVQVFAAPE